MRTFCLFPEKFQIYIYSHVSWGIYLPYLGSCSKFAWVTFFYVSFAHSVWLGDYVSFKIAIFLNPISLFSEKVGTANQRDRLYSKSPGRSFSTFMIFRNT